MAKQETCFLCKCKCPVRAKFDSVNDESVQPVYDVECQVCGSYVITNRAEHFLQDRKTSLYIISGVTRNYWEYNDAPLRITVKTITDDIEFESRIMSAEPKNVPAKAALLLQYIARKSAHPGQDVEIDPSQDYSLCFSKGTVEFMFYLKHLKEVGDVLVGNRDTHGNYKVQLTANGWQRLDSLSKPNVESKQVFVAMWFDDSMKEAFEVGIKPLEESTGFNIFRVDKTQFIDEKICDKIIIEIKKSRFLIVDVTGQRQAVYFEAGYAMGMGLPVIWTCQESEIEDNKCCFDTRQYNHIAWKDAKDLHAQLNERILATIGKA